ncbi:TYRO protein tyrosine kinase-binding protein isoform X1 [Rhineura floridana]|uniref:TYRO protein tyrosine kinase-binding protein isoform X1 n=1 Tax=Rhineura floridana TaxID=261503 RepID=UPI002AC83E56|nr:TYRO protein tyrosine kinase-binding protein isoform X1 [Rhineura floridana]
MGCPGYSVLHVLLGLAWVQLGVTQAQKGFHCYFFPDCGNCYQLSPGVIAGVVLGDLLLTLLIALAVYYVAGCIYQRQSTNSADLKKPPQESQYEELQGHRMDIYSDLKSSDPGTSYK